MTSPAGDAGLVERGLARSTLVNGRMLKAVRDDIVLPDGGAATREFVIHPGAVMVVALVDDERVVLERQYRYPMGRVMVEFPAGKLDEGESSLRCAQRELREETGYTAEQWAYAGVMHPVISYSTEHIDVWFARGLRQGKRQLDQGEFLDVFDAPVALLNDWACRGEVTDAKTLVGLWRLQQWKLGAATLDWLTADDPRHVQPAGPFVPALSQRLP